VKPKKNPKTYACRYDIVDWASGQMGAARCMGVSLRRERAAQSHRRRLIAR
jgi:hypothetical protein